jgi:hypothetical protein
MLPQYLKIVRVDAKSWISWRTTLMPRSSDALSSSTMLCTVYGHFYSVCKIELVTRNVLCTTVEGLREKGASSYEHSTR